MARAIHSMIRVLDEARSVDLCRLAFGLTLADRLDFDSFTLINLHNAETGFELELTHRRRTCISTITPMMSRCAAMPSRRAARSIRRSVRRGPSRRRPIPRPATSGPTGCRRIRTSALSTHGGKTMISKIFSSRMGRSSRSSAAENPTLTIVALAIRQAGHIAAEIEAGWL